MTPAAEAVCMHCHAGSGGSELKWKIPLIVGLFVAAFAVSVLLALAR
jgi:hypothetical protein